MDHGPALAAGASSGRGTFNDASEWQEQLPVLVQGEQRLGGRHAGLALVRPAGSPITCSLQMPDGSLLCLPWRAVHAVLRYQVSFFSACLPACPRWGLGQNEAVSAWGCQANETVHVEAGTTVTPHQKHKQPGRRAGRQAGRQQRLPSLSRQVLARRPPQACRVKRAGICAGRAGHQGSTGCSSRLLSCCSLYCPDALPSLQGWLHALPRKPEAGGAPGIYAIDSASAAAYLPACLPACLCF